MKEKERTCKTDETKPKSEKEGETEEVVKKKRKPRIRRRKLKEQLTIS